MYTECGFKPTMRIVEKIMKYCFRRVRKIATSDSYFRHVRLFVHMEQLGSHWTNFDCLIFETFSKICGERSSLIKIRQE